MNAGVPPPLWRENLPAINKKVSYEPYREETEQEAEGEEIDNAILPAIQQRVHI
jgi:hypothetical protein